MIVILKRLVSANDEEAIACLKIRGELIHGILKLLLGEIIEHNRMITFKRARKRICAAHLINLIQHIIHGRALLRNEQHTWPGQGLYRLVIHVILLKRVIHPQDCLDFMIAPGENSVKRVRF